MNYTDDTNYILESNLITALRYAIAFAEERETIRHGPLYRSCQRAAWESNLARLEAGEGIEVRR